MSWHPLRGVPGTGEQGWVYLVALDEPLGHALHYRGWTGQDISGLVGARSDTPGIGRRLSAHAAGYGSRLLQVAHDRGIGWVLAWVQPGDRHTERQLKNHGGSGSRRDCTRRDGPHAGCGTRNRRTA